MSSRLSCKAGLLAASVLWLCSAGIASARFVLVEPAPAAENVYVGPRYSVSFLATDLGIHATIANRSGTKMQIDWDSSAYIDASGRAHRVVEGSTRVIHANLMQPPTVIPAGTTVTVVAYAPDYLVGNEPGPMFRSPGLGERIALSLALRIGGARQEARFVFESLGRQLLPKSKLAAGLWAAFIPSAGHAYAGNWLRGVPFLAAQMLLISLAPSAPDPGEDPGASESDTPAESPVDWTGILLLGVKIWEVVDATGQVERWNEANGLAVIPRRDGIEVAWRF